MGGFYDVSTDGKRFLIGVRKKAKSVSAPDHCRVELESLLKKRRCSAFCVSAESRFANLRPVFQIHLRGLRA
jgi:hypothetical protein